MGRIPEHLKSVVRAHLVASAARHFAEHGLHGARIDRISTDAGYAKGTVYNYFDSKEALFGAVVEESARRAVERFEAVDPGGSCRERLRSLAVADVSVLRDDESFTKVLVREAMSFRPETSQLIADHLAPFLAEVAMILDDGVRAHEVRADRPTSELALLFVGLLSLLYVQHWSTRGGWPSLDDIPELAVAQFLDGAGVAP